MSTAPLPPVPVPVSPPLVAVPSPPPTPDVRRVSIADRAARAFPPLACVRGYRYFARGRVELRGVTDKGLDADVKGTKVQHVRMRVEDGRLGVACSCAAKVLGPPACRHVWATLLEIDRQGLWPALRSTERVLALGALDAARPARTTKEARTPKEPTVRPRAKRSR